MTDKHYGATKIWTVILEINTFLHFMTITYDLYGLIGF